MLPYRTKLSTICNLHATNIKVKVQIHIKLKYPHICQVAYSLFAIWTLDYLDYPLTAFVICTRWTGGIYYPPIKLLDCPYVRISSIPPHLISFSPSRHNLHKPSFVLRSVAKGMQHYH